MGDPNHPAVVPVCVVTGFLGSGKTTFVRHALREAGRAGVRAAALVNDVADFNVDDEILQADAPSATTGRKRTVKLSNGCVCCSIRDNLLIALSAVLEDQDPEYVLIETSGVADPFPIVQALRGSRVGRRCALDAVVTLLDAAAWEGDGAAALRASAAMRSQLLAADVVLVNKIDLATDAQADAAKRYTASLRRRPTLLACIRGRVQLDLVLDLGGARASSAPPPSPHAQFLALAPRTHLVQDGVATLSIDEPGPLSLGRFQTLLR